jgi:hypothetical protein
LVKHIKLQYEFEKYMLIQAYFTSTPLLMLKRVFNIFL